MGNIEDGEDGKAVSSVELLELLGEYKTKVTEMANTIDTLYERNLLLMTKIERLNRKFGEGKIRGALEQMDNADFENERMKAYIKWLENNMVGTMTYNEFILMEGDLNGKN